LGYAGGAAQIPHVNAINDMSHPNSSTNINASAGYAEGAAQIPQAHTIKDMSSSNSTTNIILQVTPEALPKFNM
jgi:hypothetical protein